MKADELVALASAHGINLTHIGGTASDIHGIAAKRRLTHAERRQRLEQHVSLEVLPTAQGSGSRVHRRPAWSVAEVGQASCAIPRMPWLATLFSVGGDASGYPELHRGLMVVALKLATEQNWPMMVTKRSGHRGYYVAELAALVLDADRHRPLFTAAPALYALCIDVDEDIWDRSIRLWYTDLRMEYERWLGTARGIIRKWIMEESDEAPNRAA